MNLPKIVSKISKSMFQFSARAGFTMIELLVVISVIGVLAVAVLSSINPIEQINKGRDTRTRSDAAQLINAVDRYIAIHEEYPWNTDDPATYPNFEDEYEFADTEWGTATDDWIDLLVTTSEVKQGFVDRVISDGYLYVYKADGFNETIYSCFMPTSQSFRQEAADDCQSGNTPNIGAGDPLCEFRDGTFGDNFICLP